jgi:phosphoribosyl-ATP pyrophosphohydrolase/phosphoribosyl-AMP cyclohydrolase
MLAWMSPEALDATRASGRATFFSRSRGALWQKGETSGHTLDVRRVAVDCDGDAILLLVDPHGPTCHTERETCFFHDVEDDGALSEGEVAAPTLVALERTIELRKAATQSASYTKALLDGGPDAIGAKLREEAAELAHALAHESDERVANEAADVLYHLLVGLAGRGLSLRDVTRVLAARAGQSGHEEKAARSR